MQPSQALNETRLPRAVLRQQERIKLKYGQPEPEPSQTPAEPAPDATQGVEPQATQPTDPDNRDSDPGYWKQRFKVTEGLLRAERERSATAADAHRQQIAELQSQIATLQASPAAPEEIDLSAYFTPAQIEEYGEEQCRVVAKAASVAAKAQAQKAIDAAVAPLREQQKHEQTTAADNARHEFMVKLAELQPDWQEIDATDKWRQWLAETDDATGFQRQEILDRHNRANNAAGCARMFKQFQAKMKPTTPTPPVQPAGTGANAMAGGNPPAPQAAFNPTAAEVRDFYKRAAIGKVSNEERAKFDAWRAAQMAR